MCAWLTVYYPNLFFILWYDTQNLMYPQKLKGCQRTRMSKLKKKAGEHGRFKNSHVMRACNFEFRIM